MSDTLTRSAAGMVGSLVLHGLLVLGLVMYGSRLSLQAPLRPPEDVWVGKTFEISAVTEPSPGEPTPPPRSDPAPLPAAAADRAEALEPAKVEAVSKARPEGAVSPAEPSRAPAKVIGGALPAEHEYPSDEGMGVEDALEPEPDTATKDEAPPKPPSPGEDLARRVLEYRPKVTAAEPSPTPAAAPSSVGAAGSEKDALAPRNLARAFTRAIPASNTSDPAWQRMPVGSAGKLELEIEIGIDGQVASVDMGRHPPAHLERLVQRTLLALRGGRFELTGAAMGRERLEIAVTLSDRPLLEGPLRLGFRAPRRGRPGEAHFQLESGRRVDVSVTLLP